MYSTTTPPLPVECLRWRCDPEQLGFDSTDAVPPLETMVGQDRGVGAIEFGLSLEAPGYNLYVAGPTGTGRTTTVRAQVGRAAAQRPAPPDWCYLHNFRDPAQPLAVLLPTGRGPELARDLEQLIGACRREIPRVFESEPYEHQRTAIVQQVQDRRETLLSELRGLAEQLGFTLQFTQVGIVSLPLRAPGQPLSPEALELLPEAKKADLRARGQRLQVQVDDALVAVRRLEREARDRVEALDRQVALYAVGHVLDELRAKYAQQPRILQHLDAVQADLAEHLDEFRPAEPTPGTPPVIVRSPAYERYRANVLVTHAPEGGAPVVFEPNPSYYNLLGRLDYRAAPGAVQTDFTLIKAGALHRANGGFLVLQARDLVLSPLTWEALKRSLRDGEVRVENLGEQMSAFPTAALKPEPVPLRVKVILIGDLATCMALYRLDEDFRKLFKVKAEFSPTMDRSPASIQAYAAFVGNQVRTHGLLAFDKDAVARVIEYGARLAEHQGRLATRFNTVAELVVEADYWARRAGAAWVRAEDVERAAAEQEQRANLFEEEMQRLIDEGTIAIDTSSQVVGQVNGLAVLDLGDYAFARPSRITARVGMGTDGVVNIEREVELSGRTHSKGVLILSGYLLGMYAQERPLSISARLAFEQVYSEVDGDSASSAELYALLSSLADVPLRQSLAVTGSVNQRGEIQAVGGVTRKIEGYFAVCQAQGLTGEQGVIIPEANARHLMLRQEVVDAVARGQFHVWAVRTVDQGLELLSGLAAGERQPDGSYPDGTVHDLVQQRLATLATRLAEYGDRHRPGAPAGGGAG
ncbi:MAG: AAA family ATPase [Chloroflexi bacterium]|nr:AAA family ATPase [Chloroflexota bacterium]